MGPLRPFYCVLSFWDLVLGHSQALYERIRRFNLTYLLHFPYKIPFLMSLYFLITTHQPHHNPFLCYQIA